MMADDDVKWTSHSVDVNDYVEWTERVRVVQKDCGGPVKDNIHDVIKAGHSRHLAYNIQGSSLLLTKTYDHNYSVSRLQKNQQHVY